mmetsp:Transcript_54040/g.166251  ORF Transcript_54040/g.166251 Transcript_54040/m.166251 type:complete len:278 (-) Transcript_54040:421-1254(-)
MWVACDLGAVNGTPGTLFVGRSRSSHKHLKPLSTTPPWIGVGRWPLRVVVFKTLRALCQKVFAARPGGLQLRWAQRNDARTNSPPVSCARVCFPESTDVVDGERHPHRTGSTRTNRQPCTSKCDEPRESIPLKASARTQSRALPKFAVTHMPPKLRAMEGQKCGSTSDASTTSHRMCTQGAPPASTSDGALMMLVATVPPSVGVTHAGGVSSTSAVFCRVGGVVSIPRSAAGTCCTSVWSCSAATPSSGKRVTASSIPSETSGRGRTRSITLDVTCC